MNDLSEELPPYVPLERTDILVRCQRCGSVVEGDVVGQTQHNIWHDSIEHKLSTAWIPPKFA